MAVLTISLCAQPMATSGGGLGLSKPLLPLSGLPVIAAVCIHSAPQTLHDHGLTPDDSTHGMTGTSVRSRTTSARRRSSARGSRRSARSGHNRYMRGPGP
jgi:hypothetical protein